MEQLVIVHVEDPINAALAALGHRALHLALLALHEGVIVVRRVRVVRIERIVRPCDARGSRCCIERV